MRHDKRSYNKALGAALVFASVAFAAVPAEFPTQVSLAGKTLVKNGEGLRTAIFGIKVYKAALYLPEKSSDPQTILGSKEPKQLEMQFLRNVSAEDMRKAWDENFRKNCTKDCERGIAELDKIKAWMKDAKDGDTLSLELKNGGVKLAMNGTVLGETRETPAEGLFANQLLGIWLGEHPPSGALKDGLLGKR